MGRRLENRWGRDGKSTATNAIASSGPYGVAIGLGMAGRAGVRQEERTTRRREFHALDVQQMCKLSKN